MVDTEKKWFAQVKRLLRNCDVALEVVDARDVDGTRVKKFDGRYKSKLIIVINKSDLKKAFVPDSFRHVFYNSKTGQGRSELFSAIRAFKKHSEQDIFVGVFGYPNVGKSSLINSLSRASKAKVGPRPGLTRGLQWIRVATDILVCDSPGVVPLKERSTEAVIKGGIAPDKVDDPEYAVLWLLQRFIDAGNNAVFKYYGVPNQTDAEAALEAIARKRGLLSPGGLNLPNAAKVILSDFQEGAFVL